MFVFISYLSDMDVMDLYYTIPLGMSTIIFFNFLRVVPWNGKWYDLIINT